MNQLVECVSVGKFDLVEDASAGKPMRASGIFAVCNEATKNGRRYSEKLWEQNIARLQPAIKARRLVGELDHPSDGRTLLARSSHLITDLRIETRNGRRVVVGDMEVLDTARGKDLAALIKGRVEWGVSSRGAGSTKPRADGTEDVSESDFRLYTFDAVFDPAADTAYPQVTESIEKAGYVDIRLLESAEQAPSVIAESIPDAGTITESSEVPSKEDLVALARHLDRLVSAATGLRYEFIGGNAGGDSPWARTKDGFVLRLSSHLYTLERQLFNIIVTLPHNGTDATAEIVISGEPVASIKRVSIPRNFGSPPTAASVAKFAGPIIDLLKHHGVIRESTNEQDGESALDEDYSKSEISLMARRLSNLLSATTGYDAEVENHTTDGFDIQLLRPGVSRGENGESDAVVRVKIPPVGGSTKTANKSTVSVIANGTTKIVQVKSELMAKYSSGALAQAIKPIIDALQTKRESTSEAALLAVVEANAKVEQAIKETSSEATAILAESMTHNVMHAQFYPNVPKWTEALKRKFGGRWKFVAVLRDGESLQYKFSLQGSRLDGGAYFVASVKYDKGSDTYVLDLTYLGTDMVSTKEKFTDVYFDDFDQPEKYLYKFKTKKTEDADIEPGAQVEPVDPALHGRVVDALRRTNEALESTIARLANVTRELAVARLVEGHHDPKAAREAIGDAIDPELVKARFENFQLKSGPAPLTVALAEKNELSQKLAESERRYNESVAKAELVEAYHVRTQGFAEVARRLASARGIKVDSLLGQLSEATNAETIHKLVSESATLIPATGSVAEAIKEAMAARRGVTHPGPETTLTEATASVNSLAGIPIRDLIERAG